MKRILFVFIFLFSTSYSGIPKGTLIATRNSPTGSKPIERFTIFDTVVSFKDGVFSNNRITSMLKFKSRNIMVIKTESGILCCSREAKLYSFNKDKFIRVTELVAGDVLLGNDIKPYPIENIVDFQTTDNPITFFILSLENNHTYFIGDSNGTMFLAHNVVEAILELPIIVPEVIKAAPVVLGAVAVGAEFLFGKFSIFTSKGRKKFREKHNEVVQEASSIEGRTEEEIAQNFASDINNGRFDICKTSKVGAKVFVYNALSRIANKELTKEQLLAEISNLSRLGVDFDKPQLEQMLFLADKFNENCKLSKTEDREKKKRKAKKEKESRKENRPLKKRKKKSKTSGNFSEPVSDLNSGTPTPTPSGSNEKLKEQLKKFLEKEGVKDVKKKVKTELKDRIDELFKEKDPIDLSKCSASEEINDLKDEHLLDTTYSTPAVRPSMSAEEYKAREAELAKPILSNETKDNIKFVMKEAVDAGIDGVFDYAKGKLGNKVHELRDNGASNTLKESIRERANTRSKTMEAPKIIHTPKPVHTPQLKTRHTEPSFNETISTPSPSEPIKPEEPIFKMSNDANEDGFLTKIGNGVGVAALVAGGAAVSAIEIASMCKKGGQGGGSIFSLIASLFKIG
jgi:hypothetical protein